MKNKEDETTKEVITLEEQDKFNDNKKRVAIAQGRREDESDSE